MLKLGISFMANRKSLQSLVLAAGCCCLVAAVTAQNSAEYKTSIQEIGQQIRQISRNLNANRALIKTEQDKLSDNEQEINKLSGQLRAKATEINRQKWVLNELLDTTKQLEQKHVADKATLSTLVRERYMLGKPNY
ncbi:MAG: septal ring factor EnvC (AmiA/AmiB activator), partial [Kiritimatiellia bacterium]